MHHQFKISCYTHLTQLKFDISLWQQKFTRARNAFNIETSNNNNENSDTINKNNGNNNENDRFIKERARLKSEISDSSRSSSKKSNNNNTKSDFTNETNKKSKQQNIHNNNKNDSDTQNAVTNGGDIPPTGLTKLSGHSSHARFALLSITIFT